MSEAAGTRWTWGCASLGLVGSALVAYAAPRALSDPVVGWWYTPSAPSGRTANLALVYVGMALLCCAWLAIARSLPSQRGLMVVAVMWAVPLALAPPLFSRDVYSYLAQGTILHLGHSPYQNAPSLLATLGHQHMLDAVSPFWRGTTAPYGPLFLGLMSVIAGAVGSHLVAGVLLTRLIELVGLALLAISVPRLARALGTEPRRALWLTVISPLVMLELVAAGHNDLLMVGLLATGLAYALRGRPLLGIAICALAGAIKVPALAGAVFIAVAWGREERGRADQLRFALAAAGVTVGVLGVITLVTGVGVGWLSTSVFSTPAKVRLAITPATGIGYTVASLLSDVGIAVSAHKLEDTLAVVAAGVTALGGLVLLCRVRISKLVVLLGAFLLIAAAGGPAAWPWYFAWGLTLIAAVRGVPGSVALAAAVALSAFLVKPSGTLVLPLGSAPAVVVVYLLIAAAAWRSWRRRRDRRAPGPGGGRRVSGPPPPPVREGAPSLVR